MKSIQKLIKIGSSQGVTLPAKDLQEMGVEQGENLMVTYARVPEKKVEEQTTEVVALTQQLIKRHKKALENLSQR